MTFIDYLVGWNLKSRTCFKQQQQLSTLHALHTPHTHTHLLDVLSAVVVDVGGGYSR